MAELQELSQKSKDMLSEHFDRLLKPIIKELTESSKKQIKNSLDENSAEATIALKGVENAEMETKKLLQENLTKVIGGLARTEATFADTRRELNAKLEGISVDLGGKVGRIEESSKREIDALDALGKILEALITGLKTKIDEEQSTAVGLIRDEKAAIHEEMTGVRASLDNVNTSLRQGSDSSTSALLKIQTWMKYALVSSFIQIVILVLLLLKVF
jgi:hypothetical protein